MTREELNQEKQQEIIDQQKSDRRKKITIFVFKSIAVVIAIFIIFYLYTTYVSTSKMIVKERRIINEKLPNNFDGLKIVHFSDIHYGTTVFLKELNNVVSEINERNPDLVVFTGDLIDTSYSINDKEREKIINSLNKISAKLGKYAVAGEEDDENFVSIMIQSGFIVLNNNYDFIYNDNSNPILLIGLGSYLNDDTNVSEGFKYFNDPTHNSNIFSIVLVHEPDVTKNIMAKYSADLIFAGHSHNGNIRIPFIGAVHKYDGAKKYDQEYYNIENTDLFVSSGIGTNGPGFRLFCRPSFNFLRIASK